MAEPRKELSLLDATISELQYALSSGWLTSTDLVARYLRRISIYDAKGLKLSAIPILNPSVFDEAAASDARRAAGHAPRPLEGIPYLVKDNIKVKGLTIGNGSPAFESLVANEDAACVQILRDAGAVLLGRTNMPAMAYGGMQRGVWGRAESPYNGDFLAAAYASGSSNGSAVATSANFCAFSLGTETVSSGRSPASNNAIVAYTPSKGLLPLRGVWPLYPTCDVLVPHTRTVADLFQVLDVLAVADSRPTGDFYNEQKFVPIPSIASVRPETFSSLQDQSSLKGKRIGVPAMYIGKNTGIAPVSQVHTRPSIIKLWQQARQALESCGAEIVETDFPLVTQYEANAATGQLVTVANLPDGWAGKERCEAVAHAWEDFLNANGQHGLDSLTQVDPDTIFPLAPGSLLGTPEAANKPRWNEIVAYPRTKPATIFEIPGIKQAVRALEDARKVTFEQWMDRLGLDAVVFPANADVGAANADVDEEASRFAWSNGVRYSNGNRPMRHLGVPTISIPMGAMEDTEMPVNLTFAGKAYQDNEILRYGFAFEHATKCRTQPPRVPALDSDRIPGAPRVALLAPPKLVLEFQTKELQGSDMVVRVGGAVKATGTRVKVMEAYINGQSHQIDLQGEKWSLVASYPASERDTEWQRWTSPAASQTIVIVLAYTDVGSSTAKLVLL